MKQKSRTIAVLISLAFFLFSNLGIGILPAMAAQKDSSLSNSPKIVSYIGNLDIYSPPDAALADILDNSGDYNYMNFAFWTKEGPTGPALEWYNGTFGDTEQAVNDFHDRGIKVLISAGGEYEAPVTDNPDDGRIYGEEVAKFAIENHFDGVDFDIENIPSGQPDLTSEWLAEATRAVKGLYPEAIISHAPQAPYFSPAQNYGYLEVNEKVGDLIDFYNIQFYNQQDAAYETYEELFEQSHHYQPETAVREIHANGVPLERIVIGKPVTPSDVYNTGYVEKNELAGFISQGIDNELENGGVMGWQWRSDKHQGGDWSEILLDAYESSENLNQSRSQSRSQYRSPYKEVHIEININ